MSTIYAKLNLVNPADNNSDYTITVSNQYSRRTIAAETYLNAIREFGVTLPAKYKCNIIGASLTITY